MMVVVVLNVISKIMKINTSPKEIDELLSRSIAEIIPSKEEFKKLLLSGKQIKIYIGADATGPALHLGHSTNYMVLERLRRLGHKVIILIGDFTARIGDPTDRGEARARLTREQVIKNTKNWLKQIRPLLNFKDKNNPPIIKYNHRWLSKLKFEDIIELASNFTVQHMMERDMFEKRLEKGKPIFLHEFFYPLMQGYDSVALDVDVELCGTDQTFNALVGRTLVKRLLNKNKFVITTTLLENPVTGEKMMSKSKGTGIYLNEDAHSMYGKIMAQPDENLLQLFIDCTYTDLGEVNQVKRGLENKQVNPRDVKMRLAREIVAIYYGKKASLKAQENFVTVFQKKENPAEMIEYKFESSKVGVIDLLLKTNLASSKGEARRLVDQKGISIDGETIEDADQKITIPAQGLIIKKGKRHFAKVLI